MQSPLPIFIGVTRSFWFMVTGLIVLLAGDLAATEAFIELFGLLFDFDPSPFVGWARKLSAAVLFLASLQQRSGRARPYSLNPKDYR